MFLNVIFHVYVVPRRSCQLQHVHCNYELHLSYATQILAILAVTKTTYGGSAEDVNMSPAGLANSRILIGYAQKSPRSLVDIHRFSFH